MSIINKEEVERQLAFVDASLKDVAATRDRLDKGIAEMNALREDCQNAYDHLMDARDALSELV
jgi:hypothetical protein